MLQNTLSLADKFNTFINYLQNIDWAQVATVVIAGIGIVLGVLIVLIGVFSIFGKLVSGMEAASKKRAIKRAEKKAAKLAKKEGKKTEENIEQDIPAVQAPLPVQAAAAPAPAPVVEAGISGEVVAAITAAVAAQEGGNPFVIRSVKRKNVAGRNPWARAAVTDNTRSF